VAESAADLRISRRGTWRTYDGTTGLPGPAITLFEDRTGYLWIGTWGSGVSRYDGQNFTSFTTKDRLAGRNSLTGDVVWAICQDRVGDMWFGTTEGVSRFNGQTFTNYTVENGLAGLDVEAIVQCRAGYLWIGTENGLSKFDGENFTNYTARDGLPNERVHAIAQDSQGALWIGTENGLSKFDGENFTNYTIKDGLASNLVWALLEDGDNLWIGTENGLSKFDGENFTSFTATDGLAHRQVRTMARDQRGQLWIGTREGVSCYDDRQDVGRGFTSLTYEDGLINNQVISLIQDRAGDFWFGTFVGMSQYSQSFTSFTTGDGLVHDDLRAITRDSRGNLWFGSLGGLSKFDPRSKNGRNFTNYTTAEGLAHNRVFAVVEDDSGYLWIGTENGLSKFDDRPQVGRPQVGRFENFTTDNGLMHNRAYTLCKDSRGHLWIGTEEGVSRYDGRQEVGHQDGSATFTNFTTDDGLIDNDLNQIFEDSRGRLWFATEGGISRYDGRPQVGRQDGGSVFTNFTVEDGLPSDHVGGLAEDRDGRIWIATLGGIGCYDDRQDGGRQDGGGNRQDIGRFTRITADDGLPNEGVLRVFIDSAGYLWFATWGGLSRYDGTVFQSINRRDGLAGTVVMAFFEEEDGSLWFGTGGGATCLRLPAPAPPPVFIRAVVADRRYELSADAPETDAVSFSSSAGLTAVEFHSINFKTRPGAMVYRYRLEGRDPDWRTIHEGRVEYQDLPPGSYLFQVVAVDRDLNYSMPAQVEIQITADARDEKIDELETRVQERTQELQEKNAVLEATLNQLRETQNRLIVQEKMATLGNLVAGIIHELNSPLGAVNSSADVIARGLKRVRNASEHTDLNADQRFLQLLELLETSSATTTRAIERIRRVTDSLKSFTRLDQAEYQPADIHEGLESTLTLLEHELKDRIAVARDYADLPEIHCSPSEINQVFMNVLMNASQAVEGEGEINIRTFRNDARACIRIADTGRGIPTGRLERIFDPGFSHKEGRVGLGLGLATSHSIVREHGGDMEIESETGRGTAVTISLPFDRS
jgi:ligand-binding sensor domain-containing protein/signal transduction histidine kinase